MAIKIGGKTNANRVPATNPKTAHIQILMGKRLKNISSPPISVVYSKKNICVTNLINCCVDKCLTYIYNNM